MGASSLQKSLDSLAVEMDDNYGRGKLMSRHISIEAENFGHDEENMVEEGQDMSMCPVCFDVLVDPCSLNCGHTFCELCLASVWKAEEEKWRDSPRSIQCPTCRSPTESFPQVNLALRYVHCGRPVSMGWIGIDCVPTRRLVPSHIRPSCLPYAPYDSDAFCSFCMGRVRVTESGGLLPMLSNSSHSIFV